MSESVFQTFFLLASFNIALIAVAIANFAVSASFLGRETRLSRKRMEKRKQELSNKLKTLRAETPIGELKTEVKKAENDISQLSNRIFLLSWVGAIIVPSLFFAISFITSILGMNSGFLTADLEVQAGYERQCMIVSAGTLALGFIFLLVVIRVIDSAAKQIPLPKIEVYFENQEKAIKCKRNTKTFILICITNKGEDVAEEVDVYLHFPPDFGVHTQPYYSVCKQLNVGVDFPDYNAVKFHDSVIHVELFTGGDIQITTPDEKQIYEIPVHVYERKTGLTRTKLTIEVTD